MIPLRLALSGFLSYLEPVEIDFTPIELACISGPNGAGKSSLLDAITWALFGMARKRDDSIIHASAKAAEVSLIFSYEGAVYRVQRAKPRDKTAVLEFHIQTDGDRQPTESGQTSGFGPWKALTERTLRETERRIQDVLRLDYETFVNASFFLQGKADQFTQQQPGDRKRILSSILGLEAWEVYRQRALERRRGLESEIASLDGRLQEIAAELAEEAIRKSRLAQIQEELERLGKQRQAQEATLEVARRIAATLAEQEKLVETLSRQFEISTRQLSELESRLAARKREGQAYAEIVRKADEIEAGYQAWQRARQELAMWEEIAERFREQEARREAPRLEIQDAKARLEQELATLQGEAAEVEKTAAEHISLQPEIESLQERKAKAEARLGERKQIEEILQAARQRQAEAGAENPRLKAEMEELKERIDQLSAAEGAVCPLCGQPLSPADREKLVAELTAAGREMGNRYRENQKVLAQADGEVAQLEAQVTTLGQAEAELQKWVEGLAQRSSRLEMLAERQENWQRKGQPRLHEVAEALQTERYAKEARQRLAEIDAELRAIGYEAAEHDRLRQAELTGREAEATMRQLEAARATLQPLEREIGEMEEQQAAQQAELERQRGEVESAVQKLEDARAQAPDLYALELALIEMQEEENRLRLEVGAARQKVLVLEDLKKRRTGLEAQREEHARQVGQYKQLERAFSKDGVPALLIEQALPQIEGRANEILDRLSAGGMSVRFVTQAMYKDRRREDLKETLDIQISDPAGQRDYEMFSGGEAFRVNFAIRLALSEVLAQRAGARLQTLVIDEGFGSQDTLGRQRLVEAINLVQADFAKILVITHIDELKDAFPTRIEVEKTGQGSQVRVI